ncbi:hypothetical protein E3N88_39686 [Mikania micrantha]|uniref:Reverse transcriptase/retrotransposon-derived protein RNase H-like domain-containing protein n=1 Tax=Mikania micrantha TaxID=192012 RepID=A0A5N6LKH5_9ASTR|nr:hypothetical protein E3N88_39686 [Mikania micrantha]
MALSATLGELCPGSVGFLRFLRKREASRSATSRTGSIKCLTGPIAKQAYDPLIDDYDLDNKEDEECVVTKDDEVMEEEFGVSEDDEEDVELGIDVDDDDEEDKFLVRLEANFNVQLLIGRKRPYRVGEENCSVEEKSQVPFLGHIVTAAGVQVDKYKISAIVSWLPGCQAPNCTYKEGWIYFNDEAAAAFDKLKQALITAPILRLPNFNAPFIVECDASSEVIYAILIQDDHPVAYSSTAFTPSTYFKSAYDRQLLDLPLPIPNQIWEALSMDFIAGLLPSNKVDTILMMMMMNRLSKYAHFLPLAHPFTSETMASVFCKEIVRLHGIPRSIVIDRDVIFLSHFW